MKRRRLGIIINLDPYKSFVNISLDLKRRRPLDRSQPDQAGMDDVMGSEGQTGQTKEEINFYWHLFQQTLKPGYILFEADYFPLTHIGTRYFEGPRSNFRYVSAGYDQYFSYTLFLGELLSFFTRNPGEIKPHQTGWSMAGFLLTASNFRVSNYTAWRDDWFNVQWKLMGQNRTESR